MGRFCFLTIWDNGVLVTSGNLCFTYRYDKLLPRLEDIFLPMYDTFVPMYDTFLPTRDTFLFINPISAAVFAGRRLVGNCTAFSTSVEVLLVTVVPNGRR